MITKNKLDINVEASIQRDIFNIVNELKRTNSESRAYRLLLTLDSLEKIINEGSMNIKFPKEYIYEKEKYYLEKIKYRMAEDYYFYVKEYEEFNKKMVEMSQYYKRKYQIRNNHIYKHVVPLSESYNLTSSFFKDYDSDIANYFENIYNSHRALVCKVDSDGLSFFGNHITNSYIIVNPFFMVDDSLTIAHEIMHAYIGDKTRYMSDCEESLFTINNFHEVYSIFIELVMEDYLMKNSIYKEDIITSHNLKTKIFLYTLDTLKEKEYFDLESERYSYGYLLANHFYKQYKKNPKQTKENIYQFMIDSKTYSRDYLLNNYGLEMNKLTEPKLIEKQLCKYLERQPK